VWSMWRGALCSALVKKVVGRRIVPETAGTHTARGKSSLHARRALDKVTPLLDGHPILATTKVRREKVDKTGCFTLGWRSKLHRVGVGPAHAGRRVLVLMADLDIR